MMLQRSPLDPYPWYDEMRARHPVVQLGGAWHVFRYDDVQRVLSDYAAFSSQRGGGGPLASSIISLDPPRHRQLRTLVTQAFTPRAVAQLEGRIAAIAAELLDAVAARGTGTMDIIADLAYPLPVIVIAELLGVPTADRERFKVWSDAIVQGGQAEAAAQATAALGADWFGEMVAYFNAMIAQRQRAPQDDLISALIAAEVEGQRLTAQELVGFCILLLVAGNETTTNLLGNAVLCLDEQPATYRALRATPERLPAAIEEVLRYRSPVQSMFRSTTQDVAFGDVTIPAGSWVVAWIGAANRDPAQFPDPDRFISDRAPNRHLAFGHGIHFCLGAPLARQEARIALGALLARYPALRRDATVALEPLGGNIVYGVQRLPVILRSTENDA